jgi:hypothetical protein
MKKGPAFFGVIFIFLGSLAFGQSQPIKREIRDSSGTLLYKSTSRGNQTEVRYPSGKLLMKTKTSSEGSTEVRSPSGKLLYKAK